MSILNALKDLTKKSLLKSLKVQLPFSLFGLNLFNQAFSFLLQCQLEEVVEQGHCFLEYKVNRANEVVVEGLNCPRYVSYIT